MPVFVVEERWDLSAVMVRIYWGRELTPLELALDWTEEDVVLFETPQDAYRMSGSCTRGTSWTEDFGAGGATDAFVVGDLCLTLGLKADPLNARREFLPSSARGLFGLGKNATLWTLFRRARLTARSLRLGNPGKFSGGGPDSVPPGLALRAEPERGVFVAEGEETEGEEPCVFVLAPDFNGLYLGPAAWERFVRGVDLWNRDSLARPMALGLPGMRVETADTGSRFLSVHSESEIRMLPRGARDFLGEEEGERAIGIASGSRRRNAVVAGLRFWRNMALTWDPLEDRMWLDAEEIPSSVSTEEALWAGFWLVTFVLWRLYDASPRRQPRTQSRTGDAPEEPAESGWAQSVGNFHLAYHAAASVVSLVFLVFVAFDGSVWRTDRGLRNLGLSVRVASAALLALDLFLLGAVRGMGFMDSMMGNDANLNRNRNGAADGDVYGDGDVDGKPMGLALQFSHTSLMLWALWASLLRNPRDNLGTWLGSVVMLLYLFELHYLMSAAIARYFLRGTIRSGRIVPVGDLPFSLLTAMAIPAFLASYVLVLIAAVYHTFVPYWEHVAPLLAQFSLWMGWMAAVFTLLLASATLAWIYHSSPWSRTYYFGRGSRVNDAGKVLDEEGSKTDGAPADPVGLEGVFALIGKYKEGIVFVASGAVFTLASIDNEIEVFLLTLVVFVLWTVFNTVAARAGTRLSTRGSRKWFTLMSSMSSVITLILLLLLFRLGTQLVIAHLRFNKLDVVQTVLAAGIFLLIALWPVVTMENRT